MTVGKQISRLIVLMVLLSLTGMAQICWSASSLGANRTLLTEGQFWLSLVSSGLTTIVTFLLIRLDRST